MSNDAVSENAIVIERTFEAPPTLIWQMWTEPEHYQKWYGPNGFTVPVAEMDVRVGGKRLVCMEMQTPNGARQMWTTGEYREVVPTTRLVFTESMADEHGNVVSPAAMGMGDDHPLTTEVTVQLADLDGRTKMVLTHAGMPGNQQGAGSGWQQAFDKLADYVTVASGANG